MLSYVHVSENLITTCKNAYCNVWPAPPYSSLPALCPAVKDLSLKGVEKRDTHALLVGM